MRLNAHTRPGGSRTQPDLNSASTFGLEALQLVRRKMFSMRPRRQLAALLTTVLLSASVLSPMAHADATGKLPTHFAIGLGAANDANGIGGWMPDSKIPWDYAYQYLAGGVN